MKQIIKTGRKTENGQLKEENAAIRSENAAMPLRLAALEEKVK